MVLLTVSHKYVSENPLEAPTQSSNDSLTGSVASVIVHELAFKMLLTFVKSVVPAKSSLLVLHICKKIKLNDNST